MKTTPCKGCGRPIVWGTTPDGKRIPMDPRPPVFVVEHEDDAGVDVRRMPNALVSHFATCPKAADFSGRNRTGAGERPRGAAPKPTPAPRDLFPDRR